MHIPSVSIPCQDNPIRQVLYKVSSFLDHCLACFITVTSFAHSYLWVQKTYCKVSRLTQYTLMIPVSVGQLSTQLNWDLWSGCLTRRQWRYSPWLWSNLKAWRRKGPLPSSFAYLLAGFSSFRATDRGPQLLATYRPEVSPSTAPHGLPYGKMFNLGKINYRLRVPIFSSEHRCKLGNT